MAALGGRASQAGCLCHDARGYRSTQTASVFPMTSRKVLVDLLLAANVPAADADALAAIEPRSGGSWTAEVLDSGKVDELLFATELARVFRPQARFVIVGHTHCPGAWEVPPRVIINTGSFVPYFGACAAIIESGQIEVRRIDFQKQQFVVGKLMRKFEVTPLRADVDPKAEEGE